MPRLRPRLDRDCPGRSFRSATFFCAVLAVVGLLAAPAGAGGDLNGDGNDDLVIGVPDEDVAQVADAGAVNILRGSDAGITVARDLLVTQADLGGTVEAQDRFGNAIAYGDFDGDGYDDVAIGAPAEDYRGAVDAGVVHVIYGSRSGPDLSSSQVLSQAGKMAGANERGDFFGAVVAAGNFDGDAYDDLVIGVPGENVGGKVSAGGIVVAYGGRRGIKTAGSRFMSQKGKVPGKAEDFDFFGVALAVGDFNGDSRDDVAIGAPGEDIGGDEDAGNVTVLYGSNNGIDRAGATFSQLGVVPGANEAGDFFANGLAAGDFNGDGTDDLAVGVPGEDYGTLTDAGAIVVFTGASGGLTRGASSDVTPGSGMGAAASGDELGKVLAAGDFNGDGASDLAAGLPLRSVSGQAEAGLVGIIPGSSGGLDGAAASAISQVPLPKASPQAGDQLGAALRVANFNGDAYDDLAVAAPTEDVKRRRDSGQVFVLYGSASGLDAAGAGRFHQGTKGVNGSPEATDEFGERL